MCVCVCVCVCHDVLPLIQLRMSVLHLLIDRYEILYV
jgi:hypothetical protein